MAARAQLSAKSAAKLLDLLSTDVAFRKLFKANPAAALKQVGAPKAALECIPCKRLAKKEKIAAARREMQRVLTAPLVFTPHYLNAYYRKP